MNRIAIASALGAIYMSAGSCDGAALDRSSAENGTIDLSAYERVFTEDFDAVDVSGEYCNKRWFAHTPYFGDFGDAVFADPDGDFPFSTADGILRISARKTDGEWESGILSSQNPCGTGYTQQFGYFEARMKMPGGPGVWPAFWMLSMDERGYRAEIDVLEFYGHEPNAIQSSYKTHNIGPDHDPFGELRWQESTEKPPTDEFNLYGVSVEDDFMVFYLNRKEYWRIETPEEFKQPFYILVNLALGSGYSIDKTPNPSHLYVDYIHAYQKAPAD